ncbi:MAG: flagellar type III secretion system pore protein FliP [Myxococcales bacterium]|nr:flagellar type III secretion system pore protein FliP [Myxococcales bacterium]
MSTLFRSVALWSLLAAPALAGTSLEVAAEGDATGAAVRLLVAMTALAILPGLLLVMTPFTRFIIVFSLLRQALGLQQSPPNQVLIGMAVVLTLVSMRPTLEAVQRDAVVPYMEGQVTAVEAYDGFIGPMRTFMFRNTNRQDLRTAMRIGRLETRPKSLDDIPTSSVITGFVLSELRTAFTIAIKVYLPFLVVDIVVASVLLGMGMMMLPPVVISLPFKLMVFVLMDGWGLLVVGLVDGVK